MRVGFIFFLFIANLALGQIRFLENKGQLASDVKYYADMTGGTVFMQEDGIVYSYYQQDPRIQDSLKKALIQKHAHNGPKQYVHYKVSFAGASYPQLRPGAVLPGVNNYYTGNDRSQWAEGVRGFSEIYMPWLYKGIDLKMYSQLDVLKYDFIVSPGSNPSQIALTFSGPDSLRIDSLGGLEIFTGFSRAYEYPPFVYQRSKTGERTIIRSRYVLKDSTVRFEIGSYNSADTLIIDPSLIFSTYTGSRSDNWGSSATYDEQGNAYTSGITESGLPGYPVEGGKLQFIHGGGHGTLLWDVGIMKVNSDGTEMIYATYFGGNGSDCPHSMVVNNKGELLVFGTTGSSDLPGAINKFVGGEALSLGGWLDFDNGVDMFVTRLGSSGALINTIYLGGTKNDGLNIDNNVNSRQIMTGNDSLYYNYGDWARGEIGIDPEDNIYIGGTTRSNNFPKANNTSSGGMDGIVAKLSPTLQLQWSLYIGGDENDAVYSIDVDKSGVMYATGGTSSKNLPTNSNTYKPTYLGGTTDGFLGKVTTNGQLNTLTYFGSNQYDQSYFVRIDKSKSVYIYGQTKASGSELIYNAAYGTPNSGQFIAKFNNDLKSLVWSTVFGTGSGKPNISPTAFSVDLCNRVYLSGSGREWPRSIPDFELDPINGRYESVIEGTNGMEITSNAFQKTTDGIDFYIMVMYDDASALEYATYLGEVRSTKTYFRVDALGRVFWDSGNDECGDDHVDGGTSRFDRRGNVYQSVCASCGGCNGFPIAPIPDAYQINNGSTNCNNAVAKFNINNEFLIAQFKAYPNPCADKEVVLKNLSTWVNISVVTFEWDFGNGTTSTEKDPTLSYDTYGTYRIRLIAKDGSSCNLIDTAYATLVLEPPMNPHFDSLSICAGDTVQLGFDGFADTSFRYSWTPTTYLFDSTSAYTKAKVFKSIDYILTATSAYCTKEFKQIVTVIGGNLDVTVTVEGRDSATKKICPGEQIRLIAIPNQEALSYEWSYSPDFISRINLSLKDSILSLTPNQDETIYLRTMSKFCNGIDIDTIDLSLSISTLLTGIEFPAACKEKAMQIWAYEAHGDILDCEWSPSDLIVTATDEDTITVVVTYPSTLHVIATDQSGCKLETSLFVDVDSVWLANSPVSFITCTDASNGSITVTPEGYAPYTFQWGDSPLNVAVRENLPAGTYSVTVTDALGCSNSTQFVLDNPPKLSLSLDHRNQSCHEVCNGQITAHTAGGTPPIFIYVNDTLAKDSIMNELCEQTYKISLKDANGCTIERDVTINFKEKLPFVQATAIPTEIIKGRFSELRAAPDKFISDSILYTWSPSDNIVPTSGAVVQASPEMSMTYTVIGTDSYGCSKSDTVYLQVKDYICGDPFVYVPNAFSPNGDGVNDVLKVHSQVLEEFTLLIFNRWGQIVWETSDASDTWDGTFNGELLSPAVFDFYLRGTCYSKEKIELKGNINLIR